MLSLCTVSNHRYLQNAIVLADSFLFHNYGKSVYLYYFDISKPIIQKYIDKYPYINFLSIPKLYVHSYDPFIFWYKTYAINDCLKNTDSIVYSDATNLFVKHCDLKNLFQDDMLLIPYDHNLLLNKYWTTKNCLQKIEASQLESEQNQYWAGFQCYHNTEKNRLFVKSMYDLMCDPDIACPGTDVPYPDGKGSTCLYHRCDQSVLSLLVHKLDRNQPFDQTKQNLFGDHQTCKLFDSSYTINNELVCLSPRHTKQMNFGYVD